MYKKLLKYGFCSFSILLLRSDYAASKPFRYVGVGGGVNIHGNNHGSDTDFHSNNLNAQATLRWQIPISDNVSISNNFLYLSDDPNSLISVNLHLNKGDIQPRIGVGANIVLHNASRDDSGILGDQTSPILNLGLDVKLSKQWVFFGDAYYAIRGNKDNHDLDSLAIVTGIGIRF